MKIEVDIDDAVISRYLHTAAARLFTGTAGAAELNNYINQALLDETRRQINNTDFEAVVSKAVEEQMVVSARRVVEGQLTGILKSALYREIQRRKAEICEEVAAKLSGQEE